MNEDEQEGDQGDADERTAPASPVVVTQDKPEEARQSPHQKKSKARKFIRKGWTAYKIASIIIQFLTFLVVAFYTSVTYRMWNVGRVANQRSAEALNLAKEQFGILQSDADEAANEERGRFKDQLTTSKNQAEASRNQSAADAAASLELARKSLEESRKAMEYAHRAQIAVVFVYDLPLTHPFPDRLRLRIRNTGHSTATNIRVNQHVVAYGDSDPPDIEAALKEKGISLDDQDSQSTATLAAGIDFITSVALGDSVLTAENSKWRWFVIGRIDYFDGFRERFTAYCWAHNGRATETWTACEKGNAAD